MAEFMFHAYGNLGYYLSLDFSSIIKQSLYNKILLNHGHGHGHGHKESKKQNQSEIYIHSRWQSMPTAIMDPIVLRLKATDWIRMSAVCRSWKQSLVKHRDTCMTSPDIPWLLLPQDRADRKTLSFYSMSEGRFYNMKLPKKAQGGKVCGYSKGWLAIVKGLELQDPHMFLLNPVSGEQLKLPSLSTVRNFNFFLETTRKRYDASNFVHRIEVSYFGECIIVAAIFCMGNVLGFCKPEDKIWTVFEQGDEEWYEDIIFYDKTLYALTYRGKQIIVNHSISLANCELNLKLIPDLNSAHVVENPLDPELVIITEIVSWSYMAESVHGELLKINHIMDLAYKGVEDPEETRDFFYGVPAIYPQTRTKGFEIFKVDPSSGQMTEKLISLGDDQVLFLATHGSSSSLAVNKIDGLEGNCIYFEATYDQHLYQKDWYISRESGVFYLKDGRIERSFPSTKLPMESRMTWFTPLLK